MKLNTIVMSLAVVGMLFTSCDDAKKKEEAAKAEAAKMEMEAAAKAEAEKAEMEAPYSPLPMKHFLKYRLPHWQT